MAGLSFFMFTQKIILSISAVLLVIAIFLLPKVVVDNEEETIAENEEMVEDHSEGDGHQHDTNSLKDKADKAVTEAHNIQISTSDQNRIDKLRKNLQNSTTKEKSAIFADSLATVFGNYNKFDSAAKYSSLAADYMPGQENWLKAGNSNYEAFSYALDVGKARQLGADARQYLEKVLADNPDMHEVKTKVAMTYISTEDPMKGIKMLREVLEEDPDNEQALFNLGILSMQSNQHGKAIERFERLVALYPDNLQARFYLGVSYFEKGKKRKAEEQFKKVKELDNDPAVQASVESYLQEID